ncbi:amino acid adenylation domain-containing protein, partial [Methanobrevibacter sp.]|uniref:amino acid adenylation domain-containing protein n=1 Tax=Methanobrevibacter sp. TaxID=66852 RepID=UPI00386C214C
MAGTILSLNKFTFTSKTLINISLNGKISTTSDSSKILGKIIPFFINNEERQKTIREFLRQVNETLESTINENLQSFEKEKLNSEFIYSYYNSCNINEEINSGHKIILNIMDNPDCIRINVKYNNQLYTQDYVKTFINSLKSILNQLIKNNIDQTKIFDVALKKEKQTPKFIPVDIPYIHKQFEKQVQENPKNNAITSNDEVLTYEELNQKANRIANALIKKGIEPKNNILVMLPRNNNMIAAILGILKTGCAFIPVDMEYPKERIEYIYENSQADYIITTKTDENKINIEELLREKNIKNPNVNIDSEDIAYMIYTSGSTGKPKGVMVSHLNITNLFEKNENSIIYKLYSKMKKNLAISTISFDAFLLDFMTLTFGCHIVLANDNETKNILELTSLIHKEKPDTLTCITPTRLKQYLDYDKFKKELDTFKHICVGGEKLSQELVAEVLNNCDAIIYNNYGPTETTVACNSKKITTPKKINVGKSFPNCITDVRDIDSKLLPDGVMGELYIGGIGVSKGYYNMEDKTKEKFIKINNIPYYKSGDYAIMLPNGEIDIKGRIDNQIKLRGLRIEIDEIESNLSIYPNIKQNVVLIKKINNVDYLCAYFTSSKQIDIGELKEFLKNKLPSYMVPSLFIPIESIPSMPNGKIDTKQQPEPKLESNYIKPENELEENICNIFSNVLSIETVGVEDNFFNIGGTSLTASNLIIELIKNDYSIKYDNIFNNPTPRKLARFLTGENDEKEAYIETIENYDYAKINALLNENTLDNFLEGEKNEIGNVLLTGVTGFLGIHVLYEFLKNENGTIYCLLRKGEYGSCEERLINLIDYYFDEDIESFIGSRIILIEGDITQFNDFKKLEELPIDTIINCAAIVKHYSYDDYIFKVNVKGVENGIKFANENNLKFVQISTVSVLSKPMNNKFAPDVKLNEQVLYYQQDL